ncbi:LEA type 2 family protein [Geoglobus acetivorans]|uniref:LEA type 2 family protein n=1 Tax=Geoglobus acetivorans TaxID=565033 RepID=A0ABZ3H6Q1_GEOAI|nr:LEA type 2 family protein [Geoglobus acetivorans]
MRKVLAALLLLTAVFLFGCIEPKITNVDKKWGAVNNDYSELIVGIDIDNPLPFLPLKDVESSIFVNGIQIASGNAEKISASRITLSIKIDNDRIKDFWISHLANDEKSTILIKAVPVINLFVTEYRYPVEMEQNLETNIFGMDFGDRSIAVAGREIFALKDIKAERGKVTSEYTEILVRGTAINNAPAKVDIEKLEYKITLNDVVVGQGTARISRTLEPGESVELQVPIMIDNSKIPEWWVTHVKNGEKTVAKVSAKLYIKTAGVGYSLDFGETSEFRTHLAD